MIVVVVTTTIVIGVVIVRLVPHDSTHEMVRKKRLHHGGRPTSKGLEIGEVGYAV